MEKTIIKDKRESSESEPVACDLILNSGGTTFLIGLHFSEASKDTMADKVKKLVRKNVESGDF